MFIIRVNKAPKIDTKAPISVLSVTLYQTESA